MVGRFKSHDPPKRRIHMTFGHKKTEKWQIQDLPYSIKRVDIRQKKASPQKNL